MSVGLCLSVRLPTPSYFGVRERDGGVEESRFLPPSRMVATQPLESAMLRTLGPWATFLALLVLSLLSNL